MKLRRFFDSPTHYKRGDWLAIDDVTGLQHMASELSRQWDGLMVKEPEERHPQDSLRAVPDTIAVPWARPETIRYFSGAINTADDL